MPLASVTVQMTVVVPTGNVVGASLVRVVVAQLSAVTGVPRTTSVLAIPHIPGAEFTLTGAGHVIVGFWLSITVTCCSQVDWLPLTSVTVHVTVVVPTANVVGASFVNVAVAQLSAVTGMPSTTSALAIPQTPGAAFTLTGAGHVIVGF